MPTTSEKPTTVYVQPADWRALGYSTQTDYDADMAMRACVRMGMEAEEQSEKSERSQ